MWRFMENRPSVFVTSYEEGKCCDHLDAIHYLTFLLILEKTLGKKRVLEGNYAFLMESTMYDKIWLFVIFSPA